MSLHSLDRENQHQIQIPQGLTDPSDPIDNGNIVNKVFSSSLIGGKEYEHYSEWKPADGESPHHHGHHGGDPRTRITNISLLSATYCL